MGRTLERYAMMWPTQVFEAASINRRFRWADHSRLHA
jgi:hypothetical protein